MSRAGAAAERFSRNQRPTRLFPCKFLQIFFCELLPSYFAVREESNWSAHARGHTPFPTERAFMADRGGRREEWQGGWERGLRGSGKGSSRCALQLSVCACALPSCPTVRSAPTTHGHGSGLPITDRGRAKEQAGSRAGRRAGRWQAVVVVQLGGLLDIRDGTESSHKTVNWPRNAAVIANCSKCCPGCPANQISYASCCEFDAPHTHAHTHT